MKKKRNRILVVHNYYQIPGGEDSVVKNEVEMLENHGYDVTLYTRNNNELRTGNMLKKIFLPFFTIFNFRTYYDIKRIVKRDKIDIIHVHNTLSLISYSVYYAAKKCKIPVVQTIHNFRLICPNALLYRQGNVCEECLEQGLKCGVQYKCYRNSRLQTLVWVINLKIHRMTGIFKTINYICLTEFNKNKLLRLKQLKPQNVFIKPNFVRGVTEQNMDRRSDYLIYIGRLEEIKGMSVLIEAWKEMGNTAPKLLMCGTGPLESYCATNIEQYHLNIQLKGYVENIEIRNLLRNARALILPTKVYEGFPMTIVEAYSVGTPVICSNIGNAGEIVKEGITGYKFEVGESKSLIKAISKLENCEIMYDEIFKEYQEKYTEENNFSILKNIYDSVQ